MPRNVKVNSEPGQETAPLVPVISAETWELLEYRIWNKFKTKLWGMIAAILTVSALLALLGLNSWLKYLTDQNLKEELLKMQEQRQRLEAILTRQANGWALVSALEIRAMEDIGRHSRYLGRFKSDHPKEWKDFAEKAEFQGLFQVPPTLTDDPETFSVAFRSFSDKKWDAAHKTNFDYEVERSLSDLHAIATQIVSIQKGVNALKKQLLVTDLSADAIDRFYLGVFYDVYAKSMKENGGPTMYMDARPDSLRLLSRKLSRELPVTLDDSPIDPRQPGVVE